MPQPCHLSPAGRENCQDVWALAAQVSFSSQGQSPEASRAFLKTKSASEKASAGGGLGEGQSRASSPDSTDSGHNWLTRRSRLPGLCRLTVFTQRCNRHICRQEILRAEVPSLLSETPGVGG